MYTNVHSSLTHNGPSMEKEKQMFVNQCMDKQNVVCVYNRIIFGNKYGVIIDTWYSMVHMMYDFIHIKCSRRKIHRDRK